MGGKSLVHAPPSGEGRVLSEFVEEGGVGTPDDGEETSTLREAAETERLRRSMRSDSE
jgi:hypothetical protein